MDSEEVGKFFADMHINVKTEWLRIAIDFVKLNYQENEGINLRHALLEQFLHSNLAESYEPQAKVPNVATKAVIVKKMIFQQDCKRSGNADDLSWFHGEDEQNDSSEQPSADVISFRGRCFLKFKLTDGQNVVHAIQYGGGEFLHENALPGVKILLTSRVLLRRGILLLNSSNCQVIGGDVEGKLVDHLSCQPNVKNDAEPRPKVSEQLQVQKEKSETKPVARRSGRSSDNTANLSTISPFLVRVPRIPNQLLQNNDIETHDEPVVPKREVPDIERTAVVPPLNVTTLRTPSNNGEKPRQDHCREALPTNQIRFSSPKRSYRCRDEDDLPIKSTGTTMIVHEVKPSRDRKMRTSSNTAANHSIADYFPVSRFDVRVAPPAKKQRSLHASAQTDVMVQRTENECLPRGFAIDNSLDDKEYHRPQRAADIVICSPKQRVRSAGERRNSEKETTENGFAVGNDGLRNARLLNKVLDRDTLQSTPMQCVVPTWAARQLESPKHMDFGCNQQPARNSNTMAHRRPVLLPIKDEHEPLKRVSVSSSEFCYDQPSADDDVPSQHRNDTHIESITDDPVDAFESLYVDSSVIDDSDYISFIEKSFSKEFNQGNQPINRNDTVRAPSTAVVPYKRPRRDEKNTNMLKTTPQSVNYSGQERFPSPRMHPSVMDRFLDLKIVLLADMLAKRKFWMLPKIVNVMGVCQVRGELTAKHGSWLLHIDVTDESIESQNCIVASQLLEKLLGFSVRQCEVLSREKNMYELSRCKERAMEVMKSFQRLDLVLSMEIHSQREKLPLIVKVLSLYEALAAC
ncbi:hypothetical protein Aduo_002444 [Ancylostoma duodenale]